MSIKTQALEKFRALYTTYSKEAENAFVEWLVSEAGMEPVMANYVVGHAYNAAHPEPEVFDKEEAIAEGEGLLESL